MSALEVKGAGGPNGAARRRPRCVTLRSWAACLSSYTLVRATWCTAEGGVTNPVGSSSVRLHSVNSNSVLYGSFFILISIGHEDKIRRPRRRVICASGCVAFAHPWCPSICCAPLTDTRRTGRARVSAAINHQQVSK